MKLCSRLESKPDEKIELVSLLAKTAVCVEKAICWYTLDNQIGTRVIDCRATASPQPVILPDKASR